MAHAPTQPGRIAIGMVVLGLGLLAGCGGDDPGSDAATTPPAAGTSAPAGNDDAAATAESAGTAGADDLDGLTFAIDQSFWHSGFAVTLESGMVEAQRDTLDEVTGLVLTLAGTFENLGDTPTWFAPEMAVVQGDTAFPFNQFGEVQEVPSGLVGDGELSFPVDESFDPDQAVLVVGGADQARAEVPLGEGAGDLVDLPPQDVDVAGTLSIALLDLEVVGGELRWDIPSRHDQVEAGMRALTLSLSATSRKSGNWQVFADWFALTTPDGTSVPADGAELGSLPGNDAGVTTEGLSLRFILDEDATGDYILQMVPADFWLDEAESEQDEVRATLDFSIE